MGRVVRCSYPCCNAEATHDSVDEACPENVITYWCKEHAPPYVEEIILDPDAY